VDSLITGGQAKLGNPAHWPQKEREMDEKIVKFELGKKYIAQADYRRGLPDIGIIDDIKVGEYAFYMGKNLGFAKFRKQDGSIFTIDARLAFKLFKESENG
jgi:hypothetical protein